METNKNIGTRREFLNEDFLTSLTAMIGYSVKVTSWNRELVKEGLFDNAEIEFSMTSCHKKLDLDFSIDSKEDMRNALYKLDTIISVCTSMKKDLKEARLIVNQGVKRREELDNLEKEKEEKEKKGLL